MEQPILDYSNKVVLAPMVRVGTLPFRLLCKSYGAQILYGEEIIDHSAVTAKRVINEELGTVDFIRADGKTLLYRTCKDDYPNVFQIGTSNAVTALKTAELVYRDVCGIDINMGCPKHFSVQGGMGAALLEKPEIIKDILSTLVRNIDKPITCKIRLLPEISRTIDLMKIAESTGIKAIAVHCRYIQDRPKDAAHWDLLKEIVALKPVNIPIIANGDIFEYKDIQRIKDYTGVSSVMIARGAAKNPSIFSPVGDTLQTMMKKYTQRCIDVDNPFHNSKYTLLYMAKEHGRWLNDTLEGQGVHKAKTYEDLCKLWNIEDYLSESILKKVKPEEKIELLEHTEENYNILPPTQQKRPATEVENGSTNDDEPTQKKQKNNNNEEMKY